MAALGCASCHLGNPLAFGKARAHEGLEREPGALSTVSHTCGQEGCHPRELARVLSSPMTRASGIVAVDRWVFGEIPSPDSAETIGDVLAAPRPTSAQSHLRKLCAGCHLGTRRANRDDAIPGNGSGCAACHAPLRKNGDPPRPHPPVDSRVSDDRCLGCHSRSGRISLSYAGLAEVEPRQLRPGHSPCASAAALHDGRPACRVEPDVHRAAGMSCVDCHVHSELMGDGIARNHEEEQTEISCQTCHGPVSGANATWASVDDPITGAVLRIRGQSRPASEPVRLGRRGTPLWNLRPSQGGGWAVTRKGDGRALAVAPTPSDANHRIKGHRRLSCSACHAAWAPICASCHTSFDPARKQWDFAAAAQTAGTWVEISEGFRFGAPALAVRADGTIAPAAPGMILDIHAAAGRAPISARLFAPAEPHTTGKLARTCESCHRSGAALGFGTGKLDLDGNRPAFSPLSPSAEDPSRAADGWTTLFPEKAGVGTRAGFRSLDSSEQRRVLAVGVCLPCHRRATDGIWRDFEASIERLFARSRCAFDTRHARWLAPRRNRS